MTRKERENAPGESFDGGYHLWAAEQHKEHVGKTPDRVQYAIKKFEENGIEYYIKNPSIGHFHCYRKSDDKLFQFWAGTGKIQGYTTMRGIHALIKILNG
jgi:hypothetical protein